MGMDGGGVTLSLTGKYRRKSIKTQRGWANQQRNLNEGNNSNKMQNSLGKLKEVTASQSLRSEDSVEKLPPQKEFRVEIKFLQNQIKSNSVAVTHSLTH